MFRFARYYINDLDILAAEIGRVIRRHFAYLTALVLAPLNRYLATLMSVSSSTHASEYALFSEADFLLSLSKHGSSVQFKGKTSFQRNKVAETFYKKFCGCPSFFSWLQMKVELANTSLEVLNIGTESNVSGQTNGRSNSTSGSASEYTSEPGVRKYDK